MKNALRTVLALATTVVLGFTLAACAPVKLSGDRKITIIGAFGGLEAQGFQAELDAWGATSGITATYSQLPFFASRIKPLLRTKKKPDLVIYPQPGAIMQGKVKPLGLEKIVDLKPFQKTLVPGWESLTASKGHIYGLPINAAVKSLIWYNPKAFAEHGYLAPVSNTDLSALIEKIKKDESGYPWCLGIEDGVNTGAVATDWLESYVLQYGGMNVYNKWWQGAVKFSDKAVMKAASKFKVLALSKSNVAGDGEAIAATYFAEATARNLFSSGKKNGQCFMWRMGSEAPNYLPAIEASKYAKGDFSNIGVIPVPDISNTSRAVIGTGEIATAYKNDSDVKAALEFILSDKLGTHGWAKNGTFFSAHQTFDNTKYAHAIRQRIGESMANATQFGYDASDLMPFKIGSQIEPAELTAWIAGTKTLEQALKAIDDAWPQEYVQ
jgi:alpha-glucoside transport system substrate-binding protein